MTVIKHAAEPVGRVVGPRIHISAFLDAAENHGGARRSRQIAVEMREKGFEVITRPCSHRAALAAILATPGSGIMALRLALPLLWLGWGLKGFVKAILYGGWLCALVRERRPLEMGLELEPNLNIILGNMLVSLGVSFVAYPHNVEFMVPGQILAFARTQAAGFAAEMRVYHNAREVIAISTFDQTVLRALGVQKVSRLQYMPVPEDRIPLEVVRLARNGVQKSGFLILGSVVNPPTLQGVLRLFDMIRALPGQRRFILAGYGTEALSDRAPPEVEVLGAVSAADLATLMTQCEAMVIYQPPTSGMLTRLVEAGIAGIPAYVAGGYLQAAELADSGIVRIDSLSELPDPTQQVYGAQP